MSEAKFSKGPWRLCYDGQIDDEKGRYVCSFRWNSFREFNEGNNASTARLIAAAPDLYEALEYAVRQAPELATVPGISAALAKARGEA